MSSNSYLGGSLILKFLYTCANNTEGIWAGVHKKQMKWTTAPSLSVPTLRFLRAALRSMYPHDVTVTCNNLRYLIDFLVDFQAYVKRTTARSLSAPTRRALRAVLKLTAPHSVSATVATNSPLKTTLLVWTGMSVRMASAARLVWTQTWVQFYMPAL
jgi:hypothetical protein